MHGPFENELRATFEAAGKFRDALVELKKRAEYDPEALARDIAKSIPLQMESDRVMVRKLSGVDPAMAGEGGYRGFKPRTIAQAQLFCFFAERYEVWRLCARTIEELGDDPNLSGKRLAKAVCEDCINITETLLPYYELQQLDILSKRLPEQSALEHQYRLLLAGRLATKISLWKNVRLRNAMDQIREYSSDKSPSRERFEQLLRELYVEAPIIRSEVQGKGYSLDRLRTKVARKLEKGMSLQQEETAQLAAFAEREALLKKAREAGLTPREHELFRLVMRNPERFLKNGKLNQSEAARELGVAVGTTKSLWSRIKKTLNAA